ncbi:MAG: homoserine dehydrogenase [Thaumarchaeota archaeon]|nr:homoserine dehydrogenase [Nitrososphaerota archaeon]
MRIILCGFGVVGQSFAKLLLSRSEDLYAKHGLKARIVGVFDSKGSAASSAGIDLNRLLETKKLYGNIAKYHNKEKKANGLDMINGMEAEVLIETTPSNYKDAEPGMSHIVSAMKRGLHVVTVNKGPLALAFPSLIELAAYNQVQLKFSGTVGGGTPILDYAKNSLRGERIVSFQGILNGTTNYILTNMAGGMNFKEALSDAKKKGYVEADESLDIEGFDAAAKLVILANWIMDMKVTIMDIKRKGIRDVTTTDITNARSRRSAVKLIASCNRDLEVSPREIPLDDPLCVNGTLNAITFNSEHSGQQTIIGRGAGGMETASSILRDLLDIKQEVGKI